MPIHEPFSTDPKPDPHEQHAKARKQLVLDYKATFAGDRGQRVLDDLKSTFGFGRWPAADTEDEGKIARRVFMQGPLFHIDKMLKTTFRTRLPRSNQAESGPKP